MTPPNWSPFARNDVMSSRSACTTDVCLNTTASLSADGYASFVLWHKFTWSFGHTAE